MDIVVIKSFFLKYLLLPLLVLILVGVLAYCKKKVSAVKSKTLIVYILVAALCLALPGFLGVYGNMFNPYLYLFAMVVYLPLGILNVNLLHKYFNKSSAKVSLAFSIFFEALISVISMLLGGFIFFLIFNWLSPYDGYAPMAATSIVIFIVPLSFYYCYLHFISIPFDIYKTWQTTPGQQPVDIEGVDYNKLMVLNFELTKRIEDGNRFNIKAKAPAKDITFGDWFYKVVYDYNHRNPDTVIHLADANQETYSWVFYIKKSIFHFRRFIDFDTDISANQITEHSIIICKRVSKNIEDNTTTLK